jgi:carboxypeptidase PM20D1
VRTTTAITIFNSGVKDNVIPQRADAKVNFRLLPGDTQESLIRAVEKIIDDPRVRISAGEASSTPWVSDINAPGYQKIKTAVEEVIPGILVVPSLLMATTDTRHYEDIVDNAYRFQPFFVELENAQGIHGTNEKVNADSFLVSIDLKEAIIKSITAP